MVVGEQEGFDEQEEFLRNHITHEMSWGKRKCREKFGGSGVKTRSMV